MAAPKSSQPAMPSSLEESGSTTAADTVPVTDTPDEQAIDETFAALKTLLSTVEKVQKARQNVGDIKPLLIRLLDGEFLSGEELEHLKEGVSGLGKLVKLYSDYQEALANAQPARTLLDEMLKP
ncbi:MAG: hypothetical protein AAGH78_09335 [Cyanobacteria bacterium P01_H01_bin.58]